MLGYLPCAARYSSLSLSSLAGRQHARRALTQARMRRSPMLPYVMHLLRARLLCQQRVMSVAALVQARRGAIPVRNIVERQGSLGPILCPARAYCFRRSAFPIARARASSRPALPTARVSFKTPESSCLGVSSHEIEHRRRGSRVVSRLWWRVAGDIERCIRRTRRHLRGRSALCARCRRCDGSRSYTRGRLHHARRRRWTFPVRQLNVRRADTILRHVLGRSSWAGVL